MRQPAVEQQAVAGSKPDRGVGERHFHFPLQHESEFLAGMLQPLVVWSPLVRRVGDERLEQPVSQSGRDGLEVAHAFLPLAQERLAIVLANNDVLLFRRADPEQAPTLTSNASASLSAVATEGTETPRSTLDR